jgi:hypothetical protein
MLNVVKRTADTYLVRTDEMGYWIVTRINGTPTRLFVGTDADKGMSAFRWYANH